MKTKKTSIVVAVAFAAICLLVLGFACLPIILSGDAAEYFSQKEFKNILGSLYFQGGTIGMLLGIAAYVGLIFVITMFIVALCKKRGWFASLDLLALILGFCATMNLAFWAMLNRNAVGSLIFGIALIVLCLAAAVLPLLCPASNSKSHSTAAFTPLPSTIPTVEKKSSSSEETSESEKGGNEVAGSTEAKKDAASSAQEETPAEASKANEDPVKENPAETKPEASSDEEASETSSDASKDDKIEKTEEKPMKAEKKPTKSAAKNPAPKASAATKTSSKAVAAPKAAKPAQKAQGKYEVYPEAGFFKYRLKANNGEILIVSNGYKTRDGAHKGIDTLVKAVAGGVAKIIIDKNKFAQFRLFTASDSRLIVAGEYYPNTKGAQSALESVEKFYKTDKIVDLDEIPEEEVREWRITLGKADNSGKGKFEIYIDETKKYRGRLLANNGQLLFATSAYAAKNGVTGALEKVQKKFNSADVTVTCDKQGRYQFIVYADNGSVLVMGESYKSKDRAISAAQSSKNFSSNPQIVDATKGED